jgi:16S rRNA (cytosine1402-N4)-methyltransferase
MKSDPDIIHIPVLLREAVEALAVANAGTYVDGTLGGAGHAEEIVGQLSNRGTFIGCDVDSDAIMRAQERLKKFKCTKHFVHDNFRNLSGILAKLGIQNVNGILLDLGWSSFQIADANRGLSFLQDGPLDMNLSKGMPGERLTAYDIVNFWEEKTLADIFYGYGDETKARVIAKYLVAERKNQPIATTHQLATAVVKAIYKGKTPKYFKIHPATKVFQALRIAVNDELQTIVEGIHSAINHLQPGGRLAVITFHSGEDRIVKQIFKEYQQQGIVALLSKKPVGPTDDEIMSNPRSRSAKLRVIEKI